MGSVPKAETILQEALSWQSGKPLAYGRDKHYELRQQIIEFIEQYPKTMPLKIGVYMANDGSEQRLLKLEGIIPIFHKSAKYNLPMAIWLPPTFPVGPPVAYVAINPSLFVFNPRCSIVDKAHNGRITSDYVANWHHPHSNLRDFVGDLQIYFAETPPLFAKAHPTPAHPARPPGGPSPAAEPLEPSGGSLGPEGIFGMNPLAPYGSGSGTVQPPQPQPRPHGPSFIWGGVMGTTPAPPPVPASNPPSPPVGSGLWGGAVADYSSQQQQQQQMLLQQQQQQQQQELQQQAAMRKQRREAGYRIALTTALAARLSAALEASASADKERQLVIQAELRSRGASAVAEVERLHREREALDAAAHELGSAGAALDRWLAENEPRTKGVAGAAAAGDIDPDAAIVAGDPLSREALAAQAADLALEDALSALDGALESKKLSLADYLQAVRTVSRWQFTARALSSKIATEQAKQRSKVAPAPPQTGPAAAMAAAAGALSAPAQLAIGDFSHMTGGVLMNPLAAAVKKR